MWDVVGIIFAFAMFVAYSFSTFIQGRQSYFDERVELLKLRQKRRLLKRGK